MTHQAPECGCCGASVPATRHLTTLESIQEPTWWRHQVREQFACGLFCAEQLELDADPPEIEDHDGPDEETMSFWKPWKEGDE